MTNSGPDNASGFNITDTVPVWISGLSANCTPSNASDSCGTPVIAGQDVAFNGAVLSSGETLTISIQGTLSAGIVGNIVNTASIVIPGGAGFSDPDTSNNSATEAEPEIGSPDGGALPLPPNSELIIDLRTPIVVSGAAEPAWDLVYYEYDFGGVILLDWVILEIGQTAAGPWFQVFNWGDNSPDNNSNVVSGGIEVDNATISLALLYGTPPLQTGIAIDVDALGIPAGNYQFVRITSPDDSVPPGFNDGAEVDSLEVLP